MAEGRFLSKALAHDERLGRVSFAADYLYSRIIPHLDAEGRASANASSLWAKAAPLRPEITPAIVEQALNELAEVGLLVVYRVGAQQYLADPTFGESQRGLRKDREAPSRIPAPPIPDELRSNSGAGPEDAGATPRKRREGKIRKEKTSSASADAVIGSPTTWLTPYSRAWRAQFGGLLPDRALKPLRTVDSEYGKDEGVRRFAIYIAATPASFIDFQKFAATWSSWDKPPANGGHSRPHLALATERWVEYQKWDIFGKLQIPAEVRRFAESLVADGRRASVEAFIQEIRDMDFRRLQGVRTDREAIAHLETRLAMAASATPVLASA